MPGIVQVQVSRARNLPIMDKSSELTDAFAEVKFAGSVYRTEVCPKSLNPAWPAQWFTFEVDNEVLQDEPLQIRIMDHDTYTAHDAIGKVYIPLSSLAGSDSLLTSMSGWYPIFDTLHGIRGAVHVVVKVEVLKAHHSSSLAVQFFTSGCVPTGYSVVHVLGFLEELVVNNDPEYKWIDKIRTPRASNEARQRLFFKLSAELQRKMGAKTAVAGGNAVIGYRQSYDLEGESGIVVRGIGTCVRLARNNLIPFSIPNTPPTSARPTMEEPSKDHVSSTGKRLRKNSSSDSDNIPSPTKPGSLQPVMEMMVSSVGSGGVGDVSLAVQSTAFSEFPFITLNSLPKGVVTHIGGVVCARAVKLLDKIDNPDDPETRDMWWKEVRTEVRSHARALGCHSVLAYQETTSICDNLCLLSAIGTAVSVDWSSVLVKPSKSSVSSSLDHDQQLGQDQSTSTENVTEINTKGKCRMCHVPYSVTQPPFKVQLSKCSVCKKRLVPMVILSTVELPEGMITRGKPCLVQARVCQTKKKFTGEHNALAVSKALPFLEYTLHRRLLNKLKVKGMNAVFNLKMEVTVGENLLTGVSTGTAVFLEALPKPEPLRLDVLDPTRPQPEAQIRLNKMLEDNRVRYDLDSPIGSSSGATNVMTSESESDDDHNELELSWDRKEPVMLDMEERMMKEEDINDILTELSLPVGYHVTNSSHDPAVSSLSLNSKVITSICRQPMDTKMSRDCQFSQLFEEALEVVSFKLRRLQPCWIGAVEYNVDLPDDDIVQVTVTASVVPLTPSLPSKQPVISHCHSHDDDLIFNMEDNIPPVVMATATTPTNTLTTPSTQTSLAQVKLTPLVKLTSGTIVKYLGVVSLFLIRESTAVRGLRGLDHFVHIFVAEANAITRAHVASMGGNMLLGYKINECVLIDSSHKNQAQCLLHVSGDAALVDHVMSHESVGGVHMMSPPPQAIEPIELSSTTAASSLLKHLKPHYTLSPQYQCYHVTNSSHDPAVSSLSLNSKVITSICRQPMDTKMSRDCQFSQLFEEALEVVSFKLRHLQPCWIGAVEYNVDLPDDDIVQVTVTASVVPLTPSLLHKQPIISHRHSYDDDLIFNMEDDVIPVVMATATTPTNILNTSSTQTSLASHTIYCNLLYFCSK